MTEKMSAEQANPFQGTELITHTIDEIVSFRSKVEFKSDNMLIVGLPNSKTSLLYTSESKEFGEFNVGDKIDILYEENGLAIKDNGELELYKQLLSKAQIGQVFNAKVVSATMKGIVMSIEGLCCFMPEGQIGLEYGNDLTSLVGRTIDVKLISVKLKEEERNRFLPIVSHKILKDEKSEIVGQNLLQNLKVGSIIQGTVKSIANFGVFVSLSPSVNGLIHISDLSWEWITNPSDVISVGQIINVIVLDIKKENNGKTRISLGLKQLTASPWKRLNGRIKEGDVVSGLICKITDYGIFIMLPSGVQGFVHQTELSWNHKITSKDFQIHQRVTAKIINIDWEKEKLLLSIRQTQADPWDNIENMLTVGDTIETTVSGVVNFGIFVTIIDGIEGLIRASELLWTEKNIKPDNYYLGDHLKAVVISIDKDRKRVELSHKQTLPNPWKTHSVGQYVKAVIIETKLNGIHVKLEEDNLPAFITTKSVVEDYVQEGNSIVECIIQEIDEEKQRIILALV